jgi:3-phenylpropionate/trans-cinnamate dioxygenase ferredoxin component
MNQWIEVCALNDIEDEDVMRFDCAGQTYAIYRYNHQVYTSAGLCTHELVHLADGLVMKHVIECPKHNGRFDIRDGKALGAPVCVNLKTFPTKVEGAVIYIEV